jgi:hypothetical protein
MMLGVLSRIGRSGWSTEQGNPSPTLHRLTHLLSIIPIIFILLLISGGLIEDEANARPSDLDVRFKLTPGYDIDEVLNNATGASVFFNDSLSLLGTVRNPEENTTYHFTWTFHSLASSFTTFADGPDLIRIDFTAGQDHLLPGEEGGEPITPAYNSDPLDYRITLNVTDGENASGSRSLPVTVHPFATHRFTGIFELGDRLQEATVGLVWRGHPDEAAKGPDFLSEETPVLVSAWKSNSPDPNLYHRGGLGWVFGFDIVGCTLQNGSDGYVHAELSLTYDPSELEDIGVTAFLEDHVTLYYYNSTEKRFIPVDGNRTEVLERTAHTLGGHYAVGRMMPDALHTVIVSPVYDYSSDPWFPTVLADLVIERMELERNASRIDEVVEIRTYVRNTGMLHARKVRFRTYAGSDFLDEFQIDQIPGGGQEMVLVLANYTPYRYHDNWELSWIVPIRCEVNPHRAINEAGRYSDNQVIRNLTVVNRESHDTCGYKMYALADKLSARLQFSPDDFHSAIYEHEPVEFTVLVEQLGGKDPLPGTIRLSVDDHFSWTIDINWPDGGERSRTYEKNWIPREGRHSIVLNITSGGHTEELNYTIRVQPSRYSWGWFRTERDRHYVVINGFEVHAIDLIPFVILLLISVGYVTRRYRHRLRQSRSQRADPGTDGSDMSSDSPDRKNRIRCDQTNRTGQDHMRPDE